ncbi:DUF6004 family protein [Rhizohabitans arisaemae]|uniref:DUF6004 family protein n=1 Tax=Rhizohabitans arisaemae TaxID=2720610 RepID=UPI0024B2753F|nr:DUF6004 family protein [Rhizohabitans arisaemae]
MSAFRETYESLNLEPKPIRAHLLACTTVVFGDDYYAGRRETINLSGLVQINTWPMPGFEARVDDEGYAELEQMLNSAPETGIKGFSYELDDRVQLLTNPLLPSTGRVRQIAPGKNFPAQMHIRRFGILETSTLRLTHRNAIDTYAVIDDVPPYTKPLTRPYHGIPRGDGPFDIAHAPNVLRGTTLPEAWYPADDDNEPTGVTPTLFFAPSAAPFMSMLVDPSMIMQVSMEGSVDVEINGKTERIDVAGDHLKAAGAEILLFEPGKHDDGAGVLAQMSRLAMVGHSDALGGRVMLRASWPRPSVGSLGEGNEDSLSRVRFASDLHLDAEFDIVTPAGTLYAAKPVRLGGKLKDLEPAGSELALGSADTPILAADGTAKARLTGARFTMRDSVVGEHAYLDG